jgi:hypothetical protein
MWGASDAIVRGIASNRIHAILLYVLRAVVIEAHFLSSSIAGITPREYKAKSLFHGSEALSERGVEYLTCVLICYRSYFCTYSRLDIRSSTPHLLYLI